MKTVKKIVSLLMALIVLMFSTSILSSCNVKMNETDVMASRHYVISNGMCVFLFYENAAYWLSQYSEDDVDKMGFVYGTPMKEQKYNDSKSWFDFFYEYNISQMKNLLALCEYANECGVKFEDSDEVILSKKTDAFNSMVLVSGAASVEAYLNDLYKGFTTAEDVEEVYRLQLFASKNSENLTAEINAQITDEQINAEIEAQGSDRNTALSKNIAYFILDYDNYDETEVVPTAEAIISDFNTSGNLTYDSFKSAAETYSAYDFVDDKNICPGDLYSEVDTWLFEQAVVSDIKYFETENGVQVVYYYSDGEQVYIVKAENAAYEKQLIVWQSQAIDETEFRINDNFYNEFNP